MNLKVIAWIKYKLAEDLASQSLKMLEYLYPSNHLSQSNNLWNIWDSVLWSYFSKLRYPFYHHVCYDLDIVDVVVFVLDLCIWRWCLKFGMDSSTIFLLEFLFSFFVHPYVEFIVGSANISYQKRFLYILYFFPGGGGLEDAECRNPKRWTNATRGGVNCCITSLSV